MLRIERYLTGQLLRPVIGVFAIILVILLIYYFSSYLAEAASEQLELDVVWRLAVLKLGLFFDTLFPVSMFLGIVTALGRLQSNYETTAMAGTGAGRGLLLRSVGRIALAIALVMVVLGSLFRPWGYDRLYSLEEELVARVDLSRVEPGRFEIGDEEWLIFAERRRRGGLEGVLVHQRLPHYLNILRAERLEQETGEDGSVHLVFSGNVWSYRLERSGAEDMISHLNRLTVRLNSPEPVERELRRRALDYGELIETGGPLELGEIQWRLMGPVSVLLLALVALLISRINPRKGQTARVLLASLIAVFYFSILGVLANWIDSGAIPVWPGLFWLPLIMLPALAMRFWLRWRGAGPPI